jgi:hypothetical protein
MHEPAASHSRGSVRSSGTRVFQRVGKGASRLVLIQRDTQLAEDDKVIFANDNDLH